jgi:phosphomannomutase/phosphoglucomutase
VLIEGLLRSGLDVVDIGLVPTPGLYFSLYHLSDVEGGIMLTGSHNPSEYNGFKICLGKNSIYGDQIQKIRLIAEQEDFISGKGSLTEKDITDAYLDSLCSKFSTPLNIKVISDSGNGMAGPLTTRLFKRLGCDVTELYGDLNGTFPNHHPDPTVKENLTALSQSVKKKLAIVGVAFDGDADRLGVVDKDGSMLFGDELLIIYAREILKKNPGCTIISEVKASNRLFDAISKFGGKPILWKTGHSLIKAKMKETGALLAGEMSGHLFFADRYFGFDDALYAAARLIEIIHQTGKSPRELIADIPKAVSTPEIRVDCPDEIKFKVVSASLEEFKKLKLSVNSIDGARIDFESGWGLVRASNTQPVLVYRFEAQSEQALNAIRNQMEEVVGRKISECLKN